MFIVVPAQAVVHHLQHLRSEQIEACHIHNASIQTPGQLVGNVGEPGNLGCTKFGPGTLARFVIDNRGTFQLRLGHGLQLTDLSGRYHIVEEYHIWIQGNYLRLQWGQSQER